MATVYLSPVGNGFQWLTTTALSVLAGGKINTYLAGTVTPAATFTDVTGATPNANPIILDASGRATNEIWFTAGQAYKFVITDASNVVQFTLDNLYGINDPALPIGNFVTLANLADTTNATLGDAMVGFKQSNASGLLTGAVGKTVHQKFQELVSVLDFGADPTGVADSAPAVQALVNTGKSPYFPEGAYLFSSSVNLSGSTAAVIGASRTGSAIILLTNIPAFIWDDGGTFVYYREFRDLTVVFNGGAITRDQACLLKITGSTGSMGYSKYSNLGSLGATSVINNARTKNAAGEISFDWNFISGLYCANQGGQNTIWAYQSLGSGTGNVFYGGNLVTDATGGGIKIGDGTRNCGDITVQAIQFGGGGRSVQMTGGVSYGNNVVIVGCQFDAGSNAPSMTSMSNFQIIGCSWGGGADGGVYTNCTDFYISGAGGLSNYVNTLGQPTTVYEKKFFNNAASGAAPTTFESGMNAKANLAATFTKDMFIIDLSNVFTGCLVRCESWGFIQSVGLRVSRWEFDIKRQGGGPAVVNIINYDSAVADLTTVTAIVGNTVKIQLVSTTATISSSVGMKITVLGNHNFLQKVFA